MKHGDSVDCTIKPYLRETILRSGEHFVEKMVLASETMLSIILNETQRIRLVCTADLLLELVLGHLVTQAYVRSSDEIKNLIIEGDVVKVDLRPTLGATSMSTINTGNHICEGSLPLRNVSKAEWKPEWIFHLADRFALGTPLYNVTRSTHSCMLAHEKDCLYFCEDLGRHNALDKAIGCALRDGFDLSKGILYSSGRIPADMMRKVIRSGVPIIASNSYPTLDTVELAEQYGVVLVCNVRPHRIEVYTKGV